MTWMMVASNAFRDGCYSSLAYILPVWNEVLVRGRAMDWKSLLFLFRTTCAQVSGGQADPLGPFGTCLSSRVSDRWMRHILLLSVYVLSISGTRLGHGFICRAT
jgi:hypothetical protein